MSRNLLINRILQRNQQQPNKKLQFIANSVLALSIIAPLYTYYNLYKDPQRMDPLTNDFLNQLKEKNEIKELKKVKFEKNEIERNKTGSDGKANVRFYLQSEGDVNNNKKKGFEFKADLVHFIWMYNENETKKIILKDNKEEKVSIGKLNHFDDTFHSNNKYIIHRSTMTAAPIVAIIYYFLLRKSDLIFFYSLF
ncbi:hypothetical protein ABK040_013773 [Willaertia magna]